MCTWRNGAKGRERASGNCGLYECKSTCLSGDEGHDSSGGDLFLMAMGIVEMLKFWKAR